MPDSVLDPIGLRPPRDCDGDGHVRDGTPREGASPATPRPAAPAVPARDFGDAAAIRSAIYDGVLARARAFRPIANARHALELAGVDYDGPGDVSLADQKRAILEGRTLARRLVGTWVLRDLATGQPAASRTMTLAQVPYFSPRGTFIKGGNEYTIAHQLRLKPGVYTRRKENGELESHVNVIPGAGASHRIFMEPETGRFRIGMGQSKMPLLPLLRAMGATDARLREAWGGDLAHANMLHDDPTVVDKLGKRLVRGEAAADPSGRLAAVKAAFEAMPLDPEVTRATLGHPHDRVSLDALLDTTRKLIAVSRGEADVDDRDNLAFMTLHGPEDLLAERTGRDRLALGRHMWKASRRGNLDAMPTGAFTRGIEGALTSSGLAQPLEQVNPAQIFEQQGRVSRMGEGGIPSLDSVPDESRNVQPSHFGFIDPLVTPESLRVGVDSRVANLARKGADGALASTAFRDARTGKPLTLTPAEAAKRTIAFPGELAAGAPIVNAMRGGRMVTVPRGEADAELGHMQDAYSPITNMVPLFSAVKPQRAVMAGRMITQALPLVDPEAPLVQSGVPGEGRSYEHKYGEQMGAVRARGAGTVRAVAADHVEVVGDDGGATRHPLYDNFPFNRKTSLHQTPVVRPGQRVAPGDLLARSNYTDAKGVTALGKNLRVAYVPLDGWNFEDAIAVSESAARKLTSVHMYQHALERDPAVVIGRDAHTAVFPGAHDRATLAKFDDDGVIKPGTVVAHGHPLVLAIKGRERTHGSLHRSHGPSFVDHSEAWEHHAPGVVTDVARTPKGVLVTVKSTNILEVGDKISGRYGDKGVVSRILPDHEMPHDEHGVPFEVAMNPLGTISRCYDERTEFLTPAGWKLGIDVRDDDVLLGFRTYPGHVDSQGRRNLECDGNCGWQRQVAPFHAAEYRGRMYRYVDDHVDLLVTPGHSFWAAEDREARYYRENPGVLDFCGRTWPPPDYRKVTVEDLQDGNEWLIPIPRPDTRRRHDWLDNLAIDEKNIGPKRLDPACWSVVDYDGLVFCPSVEGGFVMTRRGGKAQVAGNTNPAQHVEGALGKVAAATGKAYAPVDFDKAAVDDWTGYAQAELAKHGLRDDSTGPVHDPVNRRPIKDPFTGGDPQTAVRFVMKLHHTAESKGQGRGTGGYTAEGAPAKGGATGSKRVSLMDINSLLSHGATEVIRDAGAVRGQAQPEYWAQFMAGHNPPEPRVPHVHEKFLAQLQAAGIRPRQGGTRVQLMALSNGDVDALAGDRELENAETVDWKGGMKPVKGGLFDPALTGGHQGDRWGALRLHEPFPNPAMEDPIRHMLGLTEARFRDVLAGKAHLDGATGPRALADALGRIDVGRALDQARAEVAGGKKGARDAAVRRLGYLKGAARLGLHPRDWVLDRMPVLPPKFRPVSVMQGSRLPMVADPNLLYKELFDANAALRDLSGAVDDLSEERAAVYDAMKGVVGLGDPVHPKNRERQVRGILKHVFGHSPKTGMVQRKLLGSTTDLVGRAAITPDPGLDIDQVGVPEDRAWEIYRPFIMRRLSRKGVPTRQALDAIKGRTGLARDALLGEMADRPVIITRAPVLHRYGNMAARPVLVRGDTLRVPPLVVKGFGADFDGDAMTYHVPASDGAVRDALDKMLPSRNLFSVADFKAHQLPSQEYTGGLYSASAARAAGKAPRTFATRGDAIRAYRRGEMALGDPATIIDHDR